jgi:hypothetical protein
MDILLWIFRLAGIYLALGLLCALWLAFSRMGRLDPGAKAGSLGFRLLIIPGLCVFWPMFLLRLTRGETTPPMERNAHDRAAGQGGEA